MASVLDTLNESAYNLLKSKNNAHVFLIRSAKEWFKWQKHQHHQKLIGKI
ncbi:hypothetical protein IWT5_02052 [Secundilactobacillus silagincola]|uniref:Uncharacterized protein n=1 Tax=Secundilactobacillus silagincola TaxID=1714681 RepID=A0A1Z5J4D9_9LACO|nr:hypothetical protein IWT5_02052 [Secundilactobacillus silagincola]